LVALAWVLAAVAAFGPSIIYAVRLRPGRLAAAYADRGGAHPGRLRKAAGHLAVVDERLATILTQPWRAIQFVLTSIVIFAAMALQLWLVLFALGNRCVLGVWAASGPSAPA
jgi:hypothetical protein